MVISKKKSSPEKKEPTIDAAQQQSFAVYVTVVSPK